LTYYAGEDPDQPAVTMTQYAAKQYTKWLSGITGRQYRLPSEAEWEYAARAGSTGAYSFGETASDLGDYAWFLANTEEETHAVGTKRPNAWGLHDMHGNVAEWVLDGYVADHYSSLRGKVTNAAEAVAWPTKLYPRVIRGGSWFDEPPLCRSAARHKSDDSDWKLSDPNLPESPWWFTEDPATGVGFRIVRPLAAMDKRLKEKVWEADIEEIRLDVADRLDEGRGTRGGADQRLPGAIEELRAADAIESIE
jgi:sulfatase modifying factor 1